jgi:murein DD-endopeptidase MepM/ murein hydrolase activator NlpD
MTVKQGALLGFVGDSGSAGVVHLHLEVRRVREGENPAHFKPREIVENSRTVVCDPRNVLPLQK